MDSELLSLMQSIGDSFMSPLQAALANVAGIAMPILDAVMILVIGMSALYAAVGGWFPVGALIQVFLSVGIAKAVIEFWPHVIDKTVEQIHEMGGLIGGASMTDPFSMAQAGAALATRAIDHAGAGMTLFSGWIEGFFLFLAAIVIALSFFLISILSVVAWIELHAGAVILGVFSPLIVVPGFSMAGLVGLSFLVSSTARIVGIGLIASYGSAVISDPRWGIPDIDQEITWLHAFVAMLMSLAMAYLAFSANQLISGHLVQGRVGFAAGVGAVKSMITGGSVRVEAASGGGGSSGGSGGGPRGGGGGPGGPGGGAASANLSSTSTPVNARKAA